MIPGTNLLNFMGNLLVTFFFLCFLTEVFFKIVNEIHKVKALLILM